MSDDRDPEMDNSRKGSVRRRDQGGIQGQGEEASGGLSDAEEVIINGGGEDEARASQGEYLQEEDDDTDEVPQKMMSREEAEKLINKQF